MYNRAGKSFPKDPIVSKLNALEAQRWPLYILIFPPNVLLIFQLKINMDISATN